MDKIDIRSLSLEEVQKLMVNIDEKKFRGEQVYSWINNKFASSFEDMTNLSKELREKLAEICEITPVFLFDKKESQLDGTKKYLFQLKSNSLVETVLMKYDHGNTVCVSSQAGCRMGCKFCASTINGLDRSLTAGEIAGQVYEIQKDIGERISNIVVMGSGEPFENYDNLIKFIEIITSKEGLQVGQRHITVSTCGLPEKIYEFAQYKSGVNLAISLHAPNDDIRKTIMPVANKYTMEEILKACKFYVAETKRRISFEYALIKGVNDSHRDANELGKKLRHMMVHVNLIPVNNVLERDFKKSDKEAINDFAEILKSFGIETTVRRELGTDIDAACGQLRKRHMN